VDRTLPSPLPCYGPLTASAEPLQPGDDGLTFSSVGAGGQVGSKYEDPCCDPYVISTYYIRIPSSRVCVDSLSDLCC